MNSFTDFTPSNGAATRYFLQEVKQLDRLPAPVRGIAFQIRADNIRKKTYRKWRPSGLTRLKNLAFNLKEKRSFTIER